MHRMTDASDTRPSPDSAELLRGAKSFGAVIDDPRALRVGFDRPVTDKHRAALLAAINAYIVPAHAAPDPEYITLAEGRIAQQAKMLSKLRKAIKPFAAISLVRDTRIGGPDMIEGPDLAVTSAQIRAAREAYDYVAPTPSIPSTEGK